MSPEITVRRREGASPRAERCPYCHDALDDARASDDQVRCEGCGTAHHLACIAELGRCTVMGCARPLLAAAVPIADTDPVRSRAWREVQRRIRGRVREFVLTHCRSPALDAAELRRLLGVTLAAAERAERSGELEEAAELYGEVARIETLARPGDLDGAPRRVDADLARELSETLQARARSRRRVRSALAAALLVAGLTLLMGVAVAIVEGLGR